MTTTPKIKIVFTVKEYGDGTPWIAFEPSEDESKILGQGFFGFELVRGTTYEHAEEVADFLNRNIYQISFSGFPNPKLH